MSANEHLTIRSDQWLAAGVLELGGTVIVGNRKTSYALALAQGIMGCPEPNDRVVYVTDDPILYEYLKKYDPKLFHVVNWDNPQQILLHVNEHMPSLLVFDVAAGDPRLADDLQLDKIAAVVPSIVVTAYLSKH